MAFSTDDVTLKNIDQEDFFETALKTAVTDATDTNIYLNSLPTPSEGFLTIEPTSTSKREVIFYTSKGADYVTCPSAAGGRGISGTAQGHDVSSVVRLSDAKDYFTTLRDRLLDVQLGWINADETWTCSSDDVITVPTDATTKYSVGDKIFLQDDGADLYGYVAAVASTTLTLASNSDYTLASGSTITEPKYSKAASPVGFPKNSNTFSPIGANYAEITSDFTTDTFNSWVDVTNLTITITVPTGCRVRLTSFCGQVFSSADAGQYLGLGIFEGATQLQSGYFISSGVNRYIPIHQSVTLSPTAGSHTYKVCIFSSAAGTAHCKGAAQYPAYIMAEVV